MQLVLPQQPWVPPGCPVGLVMHMLGPHRMLLKCTAALLAFQWTPYRHACPLVHTRKALAQRLRGLRSNAGAALLDGGAWPHAAEENSAGCLEAMGVRSIRHTPELRDKNKTGDFTTQWRCSGRLRISVRQV